MSNYIDSKYIMMISFKLRNFKQKKINFFNFSCPFCGDSKRNLRKSRFYVYSHGGKMYGKCHNCGISVGVGAIIKQIDPLIYSEYILEKYKTRTDNSRDREDFKPNITPPRFGKTSKSLFNTAEMCSELLEDHFCITYLKGRRIPRSYFNILYFTENYKNFIAEVFPDYEAADSITPDRRLVIPYFNEYGDIIATTGRALINSKKVIRYITVRGDDFRDKLIYGMDRVDLNKPIKIVEGPLDSLFLSNCIASGDANLKLVHHELNRPRVTLIYDNEKRNREIVQMMENSLTTGLDVVIWPDYIPEKDINQMVQSGMTVPEIENIIDNNTFSGIKGILRLNTWKKI